MAPYPFQTANGVQYENIQVDMDEAPLRQIASITGGEYYRATNTNKLKGIYKEIDKLEKTKMRVHEYSKKNEEYRDFALAALLLLLMEVLLKNTVLRRLP